jgi:farnesyl-diphosphate farnesyltransferase
MFKDRRDEATSKLSVMKKDILAGKEIDTKVYTRMILQKVSRTYALTIRSLGQPFREPVLVGYLLCRIADTYEDSATLPYESKFKALTLFLEILKEDDSNKLNELRALLTPFSIDDDEEFLAIYPELTIARYREFDEKIQEIMYQTVSEMVEGMKSTITKQHTQGEVGTDTEEELEEYCYYVAGTVGNMLTALFHHLSPWIGKKLYEDMAQHNEAFGQALQLTNIIKDAMGDLKRGVSFIPKELAHQYRVDPDTLYLPENREAAKSVMNHLILKATRQLNVALKYCLMIPKQEPRMRLFTVMPVMFAIKTLGKAMDNYDELLDPDGKVKISREDVKSTIKYITINCLWDYQLVKEYQIELKKVENKLGVEIPLDMKMFPFLPVAFT